MVAGVVIPAYNEEARLPAVLAAVVSCAEVTHVVVVDDGSVDGTYAVACCFDGVEVVRLAENRGKAGAVWEGLKNVDEEVVVFLDADLLGLKPSHVSDLILPVAANEADMTVGIFKNGRWATDFSHWWAPFVSGQRAIRRERLLEIPPFDDLGYGLEAALNRHARRGGWRVQRVILRGVSHVMKEEKMGFLPAARVRARMYREVLKGLWRNGVNGYRW